MIEFFIDLSDNDTLVLTDNRRGGHYNTDEWSWRDGDFYHGWTVYLEDLRHTRLVLPKEYCM